MLNTRGMKEVGNEWTHLNDFLSARAREVLESGQIDPLDIYEQEETLYRVKDEFWEKWGSEYDGELLPEAEIDRLADEWGKSFSDLLEELEEVPVYTYFVRGIMDRDNMTGQDVSDFLEEEGRSF